MKRLNELDMAKGIGIFLVVLGHTCRSDEFKKLIYFFHLPLFFIISGFLFNIKKYDRYTQFLKENIKSLLLPYATFYLISFLYWALFERAMRPGSVQISLLTPLTGFFYGTDYKFYMLPNGAVWFLLALFMARNFLYVTVRYVESKILFVFIIALSAFIGYYISISSNYKLPFSINSAFVAFFFVGFGYLFKPFYKHITDNFPIYTSLMILALIVSFVAVKYNSLPDMDYCRYGNIILFLSGGISGTLLCIFLCRIFGRLSVLQYLGKNSLIIMGISEPVKRAVIGVFSKLSHYSVNVLRASVGLSLLCTLLTLLLLIPIIYIFNKYLFFAIGIKREGENIKTAII